MKKQLKFILPIALLLLISLSACGSDTPTAATTAPATTVPATTVATTAPATTVAMVTNSTSLRNLRYCEVIPVYQEGDKFVQYVYNTQGFSSCPDNQWKALDANNLAKSLGALKVNLNGPRYWLMDKIEATGATANGEVKTFGELKMQLRAKVEVPVSSATIGKAIFYAPNIVERTTNFIFSAGKPTYQLLSPEGDIYVMQTYSQIIDPKLTMEDLPNIAPRLKLPNGWQYKVVVPDQDLIVPATGKAVVIQDDLTNSYQKFSK